MRLSVPWKSPSDASADFAKLWESRKFACEIWGLSFAKTQNGLEYARALLLR
jgi:hypothetical protein